MWLNLERCTVPNGERIHFLDNKGIPLLHSPLLKKEGNYMDKKRYYKEPSCFWILDQTAQRFPIKNSCAARPTNGSWQRKSDRKARTKRPMSLRLARGGFRRCYADGSVRWLRAAYYF